MRSTAGASPACRKITFDQKGHVLRRNVLRGEIEEGVLGLEVADLQQTVEVLAEPLAPLGQSTLRLGEGEEFGALEIVEIRQAIERAASRPRRSTVSRLLLPARVGWSGSPASCRGR